MGKKGVIQSSQEEYRNLVRSQIEKKELQKKNFYDRCQQDAFNFLDRPATRLAYGYHFINLSLILGSIIISVCSTVAYFNKSVVFKDFIMYYEVCLLIWFTVEYIVRVWGCVTLGRYATWKGRLLFMKTFYMVVDGFVILTTLTTILLQVKHSYFTMLRITRFLQVFRVLRLDRQRGDLRTMGNVVYKHKKELVTCYFVGFIILFGGTYIIYIVEKSGEKPAIDNMANGIYWAMITVTSVGYGDISPETWGGKICTGIFALVGCAFFSLPAGILGSGFALQVAKQKKEKRYNKIKNPAAIVIQNLWRNHAVKKSSHQLQATWEYLFPHQKIQYQSYYKELPGIKAIHDAPSCAVFRASLGRKRTADAPPVGSKRPSNLMCGGSGPRNKKVSTASSMMTQRESNYNICPQNEIEMDNESRVSFNESRVSFRSRITNATSRSNSKRSRAKEQLPISELISYKYKQAIRFILRVKHFTEIRKFKKDRYPFISVQDIMEKNSHDHLETLSYLKEISMFLKEFQDELDEMKMTFQEYKILAKSKQGAMMTTPMLDPRWQAMGLYGVKTATDGIFDYDYSKQEKTDNAESDALTKTENEQKEPHEKSVENLPEETDTTEVDDDLEQRVEEDEEEKDSLDLREEDEDTSRLLSREDDSVLSMGSSDNDLGYCEGGGLYMNFK